VGIPEGGVGGEERKHTRGGPLGILEGGVDRQERRHTGGGTVGIPEGGKGMGRREGIPEGATGNTGGWRGSSRAAVPGGAGEGQVRTHTGGSMSKINVLTTRICLLVVSTPSCTQRSLFYLIPH